MRLSDFIPQLASALRLPGLVAGRDGACAFRVGEVTVQLIPRPSGDDAFVARACLGPVDPVARAATLERLLAANFFGNGAGGPVLGLDAQDAVFLTQHFQANGLGFEALFTALERFVVHAAECRGLLAHTAMPILPTHHGYA
jgi:hypothetical protein